MVLLDKFPHWLECEDQLAPADALLVLDGGDIPYRFAVALDLLHRGYGSRLLVSQTVYCTAGRLTTQDLARAEAEHVYWIHSQAISTREEAVQARQALRQLGCRSVLVVTSSYHARRAKDIFTRVLKRDGIQVRVVPAPVPVSERKPWWKSREGRSIILFEAAKLVCAWLHLDPHLSPEFRLRLKERLQRAIP